MTFYTGYWTTVAREIPFSFIQFPIYEGLKKGWRNLQGSDTTPMQGAVCGSISGAISSAVTTPLDVVKTRMMLGSKTAAGDAYVGTVNSLQTIAREEGAGEPLAPSPVPPHPPHPSTPSGMPSFFPAPHPAPRPAEALVLSALL